MIELNAIQTIITHGGVFHADDVCSVALLELATNATLNVVRVIQAPKEPHSDNVVILDIGGGEYDHHQENAECHENGDKFSAVGLVYRDIKQFLIADEKSQLEFELNYIRPIELNDNLGPVVAPNPLSLAIGAMNPNWDDTADPDLAFRKAVSLVKEMFRAVFARYEAIRRAKDVFEKGTHIGRTIILDQYAPIDRYAVESGKYDFMIYPGKRGGWDIKTLNGGEIKVLPPTPGYSFRHVNGFLSNMPDKQSALDWAVITYMNRLR